MASSAQWLTFTKPFCGIALKTLSLDTDTWQAFQSACAELEITPEDCFDAWSNFFAGPESQETAMEFLKQESGNSRNLSP